MNRLIKKISMDRKGRSKCDITSLPLPKRVTSVDNISNSGNGIDVINEMSTRFAHFFQQFSIVWSYFLENVIFY